MVLEHTDEHDSQWAAISSIAEKIGCSAETLRNWVRQAERDQGRRAGARRRVSWIGLRWGELTRAQAAHVERGFLVVSKTKSSKVRRVPLDPQLLTEIQSHVGKLVPFAECSPGSFTRVVRKLSSIADFHPHRMRHTFACSWLEQGGSLAALQQVLGQASIVTTQRYARLTDDHVMAERLKMGNSATKSATSVS